VSFFITYYNHIKPSSAKLKYPSSLTIT
jgi:hypothetical protein